MTTDSVIAIGAILVTVAIAIVGFVLNSTRRSLDDLRLHVESRSVGIDRSVEVLRGDLENAVLRIEGTMERQVDATTEVRVAAAALQQKVEDLRVDRVDRDQIFGILIEEVRSSSLRADQVVNTLAEVRQALATRQAEQTQEHRSAGAD